jgi:hypothetical protein
MTSMTANLARLSQPRWAASVDDFTQLLGSSSPSGIPSSGPGRLSWAVGIQPTPASARCSPMTENSASNYRDGQPMKSLPTGRAGYWVCSRVRLHTLINPAMGRVASRADGACDHSSEATRTSFTTRGVTRNRQP